VNKKSKPIQFELGGKLFRLFLFLAIWQPLSAQVDVHYASENLRLDWKNKSVEGTIKITLTNTSENVLDSLTFLYWPNAYRKNTPLDIELREDQSAKLHFANFETTGSRQTYLGLPQTEIKGVFIDGIPIFADEMKQFGVAINPGQTVEFLCFIKEILPDAKINGYGYDASSIRLSHWLPRVVPPTEAIKNLTYNSRNRDAWFVNATYDLNFSLSDELGIVSNLNSELVRIADGEKHLRFSADAPQTDALFIIQKNSMQFEVPTSSPAATLNIAQGFPPFKTAESWERIVDFLKNELGWQPASKFDLVFLKNKNGLQSSGTCILIDNWQNQDDLEGELVDELVQVYVREALNINPATHPFLVKGMANYYKHLFFNRYYPDKMLLGPLAKTFVARFFDVDHYPIAYQNRMLYLYMARQGLDQPLNNTSAEYSRFNREAVVLGKSSLWFSYLRSYVGEKNFLRGMHRWRETCDGSPESLIRAMRYYHNQDLNWLLGDLYTTAKKLDYKLVKTDYCNSVYTATVRNKGNLSIPFSITGFNGDAPVLTEWKDGFAKKKTVQIHLEEYTSVKIDAENAMPETTQKNNEVRTKGLFKGMKPLKMQFYTSFENPERTQIFWLPSINYNAYDQFLLGAQFTNANLFRKPIEWKIAPVLSTGTGTLTGSASLKFNLTPYAGPAHLITFGMYGRYFHYAPDLAYTRLSPTLTFNMRKPHPRSEWINTLRIRGVYVNREIPAEGIENPVQIDGPPSYRVLDARWRSEKGSLLSPIIINVDAQLADSFSKLSVEFLQRWRITKNHLLTGRIFGGVIFSGNPDPFFKFGVSGTTDYLFDYYFIGRSDKTGIWSQQMFVTDGGFKSQTSTYVNQIFAANLNLPFYRFVGTFGNIAYVPTDLQNQTSLLWDYGLYLEFIPDFFEFYFPIQNNQQFFLSEPSYYKQIRFVLNIELDAVINRVRRGWY
jgi:hypothetical protein